MKRILRVLALFLCVCILTLSSTSCVTFLRLSELREEYAEKNTEAPIYSEEGESPLTFSLTKADADRYATLLEEFRALAMAGEDKAAIEAAEAALEELYYDISTQAQIAYLLYCCDMSDETASENYLFASEMSSKAYGDYTAACRALYESDSAIRDEFFQDWSEEEISEMQNYSEEITALTQENDRLLVEYRELSDENFINDAPAYFLKLVKNNTRVASLMGFDSYYEYAHERTYDRDYGSEELTAMRSYVKTYIAPYVDDLYLAFDSSYRGMSSFRQRKVYNFLYADYDSAGNYVKTYLSSLPEDMRERMSGMLKRSGSVFAEGENAYQGAFTAFLYDREKPFCYFGPEYQSTNTVVHEMGHYYAACFGSGYRTPMDLAEVQSQANEWLMLASLAGNTDQRVLEALQYYLVYDLYVTVVASMIVDEFEERVYRDGGKTYTTAESLDALMRDVCLAYGGIDFVEEYVTDIQYYWRIVAVESPVYYVSYATSGVVALEFYLNAQSDFAAAVEAYAALTERGDHTVAFCEAIGEAGLLGAFCEETYKRFQQAFS